jgi:glycerol uptake facilitator-like aquaporin
MVKLAFGSLGDSFSAASLKAYVAEFIATLLFVFAGVGSDIAYCELFYYHFASTSSHFSFHFLPHH